MKQLSTAQASALTAVFNHKGGFGKEDMSSAKIAVNTLSSLVHSGHLETTSDGRVYVTEDGFHYLLENQKSGKA